MSAYEEAKKTIEKEFADFVYNECVPVLKSLTPVGKDGTGGTGQWGAPRPHGRLRNSIHAEKISDRKYWVGTNLFYGKFVENGRGPVSPVNKKALYWYNIPHPVAHAGPAKAQHIVDEAIKKLGG